MYANLDIRQSYAQNFTTSQTRFWQDLIPFSKKLSRLRTRQISSQFVGQETCTAYTFHLAKYGDIVNIENGNSYGNGSFIATPTAARPAIFHISSCRALVVVRTVGVAEKITLNGQKSFRREHAAQMDSSAADTVQS